MSNWREMLEEAKSLFDDGLIDETEYKQMKQQAIELRDQGVSSEENKEPPKIDPEVEKMEQELLEIAKEEERRERQAHSNVQTTHVTPPPKSGVPMLVWVFLGLGGFMVVGLGLVILLWPSSPSHTEHSDAYSMTCAEGWKFSDHSTHQYKDLRCEPDSLLGSGLFILQVYDDTSLPVTEMHEIFLEGFIPAYKQMVSNFSINPGSSASYGSFSGFQSTYSASVLGVRSDGMILTFQGCGKTFVVMNQAAEDDRRKYASDFEFMESSLHCN